MTHGTTLRRTLLGLLSCWPMIMQASSASAADEHLATAKLGKAAVACQKVIARAGAKILAGKHKALDGCANAALTCVETKHDDPTCLTKAGGTCAKQLDKAATSLTKAVAKIVGAKSCAVDLRLPDLLGSDGLGLGDVAGACLTDFGLDVCTGLEPLATCVLRTRDRAAGVAYGEARPRTGELLGLLPTALPPVDGLPTYGGCGACGAPADRRKAVEKCGKALTKAQQGLGASLEKTLAACAQKVLGCVETKSDDPKCLAGATAGCTNADSKITAALEKFTSAVAKKCDAAAVDFATIGDPSGLALAALATTCTTAPGDATALVTCLLTRAQCTTAEVVRQAIPRIGAFDESGHLGTLGPDLTAACAPALSSLTTRATFAPRPFVFGSIIKFLKGVRRTQGASGVLSGGGRPSSTGFGRGLTRLSGPRRVTFGGIGKIQFRYKIGGALSRGARVAPPPSLIVAVQRADVSLDDHFEVTLVPPPGVSEVDDEIEVTYQDTIPGCAFTLALATKIDGVVSEYTPLLQVVDTVVAPTPTATPGGPTPTPTSTVPTNITQIIDATGDGAGNVLDDAIGVAADATGNAYVIGATSDNAFKITSGGTITEIIDATGDGVNALNFPSGVAVDSGGNVYMTSIIGDFAFKITPLGVITTIIDGTDNLVTPIDVAVDDVSGNVYVTGIGAPPGVFKIVPGGTVTQILDQFGDGVHSMFGPTGVAVDGFGNVFVSANNSDNVFKITPPPGSVITQVLDASGDGVHSLDEPLDVAADGAGNAYVIGRVTNNVFKIASGGTITQILDASGDGGGNTFSDPRAITVDGTGNVYVAANLSRNAFKIASGGGITEIIDLLGDHAGHFLQIPGGIAVDGSGNVFVSDRGSRVFKIAP